jgi:hypothetical protein
MRLAESCYESWAAFKLLLNSGAPLGVLSNRTRFHPSMGPFGVKKQKNGAEQCAARASLSYALAK